MTLRERALELLARREHSRVELTRKLASFAEFDEVQQVLNQLEQENLLSDERFAKSLANARTGRHGSLRLKADLRDKGVPEEVLVDTVNAARESDLAMARAVWTKKYGQPATDASERAKQMRFLAGRGFPMDVIRQVVSGLED